MREMAAGLDIQHHQSLGIVMDTPTDLDNVLAVVRDVLSVVSDPTMALVGSVKIFIRSGDLDISSTRQISPFSKSFVI